MSICGRAGWFPGLTLKGFLRGYRAFAEHAVEIGFIQYESFVRDPVMVGMLLCSALGAPFDREFIWKWQNFSQVTGDPVDSGGKIEPRARKPVPSELLRRLDASMDYRASLELLQYEGHESRS